MKLFYKDALVAAYMKREFGVRLYYFVDISLAINQECEPNTAVEYGYWHLLQSAKVDYDSKKFVHEESYHIFEPQEGDKNIDGYVFNGKLQGWEKEWVQDNEPILLYKLPHELPISERNGKAFIMPEREE